MEIKEEKIEPKSFDTINVDEIQFRDSSQFKIGHNKINVVLVKNEISVYIEDKVYLITLSPQDIRKLMNWWMGQEQHKEDQRRHEEKSNIPESCTIDWSQPLNKISLTGDVKFDFTNIDGEKYHGIQVIIDIDGVGGFESPIWPDSIVNPPLIPTLANTRATIVLYTTDGGKTITHATEINQTNNEEKQDSKNLKSNDLTPQFTEWPTINNIEQRLKMISEFTDEENQKIVDEIRKYLYNPPDRNQYTDLTGNPISDESWKEQLEGYRILKGNLERIIAEATGRSDSLKDIKDL